MAALAPMSEFAFGPASEARGSLWEGLTGCSGSDEAAPWHNSVWWTQTTSPALTTLSNHTFSAECNAGLPGTRTRDCARINVLNKQEI